MSLLEEFLESAQFLPIELQRSCLLVQEIDEKSKCLESEVAELQQQYLEGLEKGNKEQVDEHNNLMDQIKQKHLKSIHYADEKINNINCLHEFVEKYVKLLDDKIRKIEEEQKNQEEVYTYDFKKQFPQTVPGPSPYKKRQIVTSKEISFPEDKPFMPDEINEEEYIVKAEKYCTCLKNTGGEMIGCDNKSCKYQWFHFECVGITQQPKGKWYCPDCKIKKEA